MVLSFSPRTPHFNLERFMKLQWFVSKPGKYKAVKVKQFTIICSQHMIPLALSICLLSDTEDNRVIRMERTQQLCGSYRGYTRDLTTDFAGSQSSTLTTTIQAAQGYTSGNSIFNQFCWAMRWKCRPDLARVLGWQRCHLLCYALTGHAPYLNNI